MIRPGRTRGDGDAQGRKRTWDDGRASACVRTGYRVAVVSSRGCPGPGNGHRQRRPAAGHEGSQPHSVPLGMIGGVLSSRPRASGLGPRAWAALPGTGVTIRAMAQMKPTILRAMDVAAATFRLPAAFRCGSRLHSPVTSRRDHRVRDRTPCDGRGRAGSPGSGAVGAAVFCAGPGAIARLPLRPRMLRSGRGRPGRSVACRASRRNARARVRRFGRLLQTVSARRPPGRRSTRPSSSSARRSCDTRAGGRPRSRIN